MFLCKYKQKFEKHLEVYGSAIYVYSSPSITYDAVGNVTKETNQKGAVVTRTYDPNGNNSLNECVSVKDAMNHTVHSRLDLFTISFIEIYDQERYLKRQNKDN